MDINYTGRICKAFNCAYMGGHICCADCPERNSCKNPCLNHPVRCNLVSDKECSYPYEEGPREDPPVTKRKRKFTDDQAFLLWQEGMSDSEIGRRFGVSRQIICRWRDAMELPTTYKDNVDTSRYRLVHTKYGNYAVCE